MMCLMNLNLYVKDQRVTNIGQVAAYDNSEGGSKTGTVWDNITGTADNIPSTEIPATFKIDLDDNINYINPKTGTNTNATEHMGEYVGRFGEESWSMKKSM